MTVHTAEHIRIKSANVPPAQTWNRLRANSLALTVPKTPDAGTVYLPLPRLFERIECGMGPEVTDYIDSQVFEATYHEVPAHTTRKEPIVISVSAAENECTNTGIMVREGAEATIVVVARAGEKNTEAAADNTGAKANAEADAPATSAALVRIVAEKHARIHLVEMLGVDDDQQHLESVGIVKNSTEDRKIFYQANQRFKYYLPLRAIFAGVKMNESVSVDKRASSIDRWQSEIENVQKEIDILVLFGVFVDDADSDIDMLIVGNNQDKKLSNWASDIEKKEGRELNYMILSMEDFYYRYTTQDTFIKGLFENNYKIVFDKENILEKI